VADILVLPNTAESGHTSPLCDSRNRQFGHPDKVVSRRRQFRPELVAFHSFVPQLALFELPYVTKDDEHLVRILTTLRPEVERLLAPFNLKPFGYFYRGYHSCHFKNQNFHP